ncbi:MAG TPA: NAD(P)-dependent oxidoreductase [Ignavibacteria bacterium]|nr:NAD(P)-dependent oxidoreductase [Ignavibacteria bacterium]HMR40118.1 NAD(P)-dependent oxidoreductase [Ignavibacteria bacterium]
MEDIIVTGATGFIGRRLIKDLLKVYEKDRILCLIRDKTDELEISGRKILEDLNVRTKIIDLVSGKGMEDLPEKPKIIFHLAASTESGDKDHRCNDKGTQNLLNAFSGLNKNTRFIFTSTTAIFSGRKDLEKPLTRYSSPYPSNEYGRTKLAAENILYEYSERTGMECIVFRLSTVWGEGTRKDGLFDKINKLVKNGSLIPGLDWKGRTGLINVNNVSAILVSGPDHRPEKNFSQYILSHESLTLAEISEVICRKNNVEYRKIKLPGMIWKAAEITAKRSADFERIIPGGLYNLFWRLNLIVNDSLHCKPDEFLENLRDLKIELNNFCDDY